MSNRNHRSNWASTPDDGRRVGSISFNRLLTCWLGLHSRYRRKRPSGRCRDLSGSDERRLVSDGVTEIDQSPAGLAVGEVADLAGVQAAQIGENLAIDCLAGVRRMPAEGEALLDRMDHNESRWRSANLNRTN